jgi:hypothetical protein
MKNHFGYNILEILRIYPEKVEIYGLAYDLVSGQKTIKFEIPIQIKLDYFNSIFPEFDDLFIPIDILFVSAQSIDGTWVTGMETHCEGVDPSRIIKLPKINAAHKNIMDFFIPEKKYNPRLFTFDIFGHGNISKDFAFLYGKTTHVTPCDLLEYRSIEAKITGSKNKRLTDDFKDIFFMVYTEMIGPCSFFSFIINDENNLEMMQTDNAIIEVINKLVNEFD